jgi:hypothetical protein
MKMRAVMSSDLRYPITVRPVVNAETFGYLWFSGLNFYLC